MDQPQTNRKRYCCYYCNTFFYQIDAWQRHNRKHTGVEIECDDCGDMLSDHFELKIHQRVCTASRVYSEDSYIHEGYQNSRKLNTSEKIHDTPDSTSIQDTSNGSEVTKPAESSNEIPEPKNDNESGDEKEDDTLKAFSLEHLIGEDTSNNGDQDSLIGVYRTEQEAAEETEQIGVDASALIKINSSIKEEMNENKQIVSNGSLNIPSYDIRSISPPDANIESNCLMESGELSKKYQPYFCKNCGARFTRKDSVTRHLKKGTCSGKSAIVCNVCGKIYIDVFELQKHYKLEHKNIAFNSRISPQVIRPRNEGENSPSHCQPPFRLTADKHQTHVRSHKIHDHSYRHIAPPLQPVFYNSYPVHSNYLPPRGNYRNHQSSRLIDNQHSTPSQKRVINERTNQVSNQETSRKREYDYMHREIDSFDDTRVQKYVKLNREQHMHPSFGHHTQGANSINLSEYTTNAMTKQYYDHRFVKSEQSKNVEKNERSRLHQCKICGLEFPRFDYLLTHLRKHKEKSDIEKQDVLDENLGIERTSSERKEEKDYADSPIDAKNQKQKIHTEKLLESKNNLVNNQVSQNNIHDPLCFSDQQKHDALHSQKPHDSMYLKQKQPESIYSNNQQKTHESMHPTSQKIQNDSYSINQHKTYDSMYTNQHLRDSMFSNHLPHDTTYSVSQVQQNDLMYQTNEYPLQDYIHTQVNSDNGLETITPGIDGKFRPFICENCGQRFTRKDSLVRHAKKLTCFEEMADLKCHECEKSFRYHKCLVHHQDLIHGIKRPVQNSDDDYDYGSESGKSDRSDEYTKDINKNNQSNVSPATNEIEAPPSMLEMKSYAPLKQPLLPQHFMVPLAHAAPQTYTTNTHQIEKQRFIQPKSEERPPKPKEPEYSSFGFSMVPRPFQCEYCGDRFAHRHSLKRHVRRHLGIGIPCHECGKLYRDQSEWRRHQRSIHNRHYEKADVPSRISFRDGVEQGLIGVVQNNDFEAKPGDSESDHSDSEPNQRKEDSFPTMVSRSENKTLSNVPTMINRSKENIILNAPTMVNRSDVHNSSKVPMLENKFDANNVSKFPAKIDGSDAHASLNVLTMVNKTDANVLNPTMADPEEEPSVLKTPMIINRPDDKIISKFHKTLNKVEEQNIDVSTSSIDEQNVTRVSESKVIDTSGVTKANPNTSDFIKTEKLPALEFQGKLSGDKDSRKSVLDSYLFTHDVTEVENNNNFTQVKV